MRKGDSLWQTMLLVSFVIGVFSGCRQSTPRTAQNNSTNQTTNSQPSGTAGQAAVDKGDLKLRYQARKNTNAATNHSVGANPQAIEKLVAELNERLLLPFDIVISFEDCEEPDAYYEPETHQITLCHQLIDEYYDLFGRSIKDKTKLDDAVRSAIVATFFH